NGNFEDSFADERPWPDAIEQILFCDELPRTGEEMVENCEGLGSELDGLCAAPQALVGQVQTKAIETYTFVVHHCSHRTFPKGLRQGMTYNARTSYCPLSMERWQ